MAALPPEHQEDKTADLRDIVARFPGSTLLHDDDGFVSPFKPFPRCYKCRARMGERHRNFCSFSKCRRSGLVHHGQGRWCQCWRGPSVNYTTGLPVDEFGSGRIDGPGVLPLDEKGSCQQDVPWDGYHPEARMCGAV